MVAASDAETKAVSDKPTCWATFSFCAVVSAFASRTTPAGFPPASPSLKALTIRTSTLKGCVTRPPIGFDPCVNLNREAQRCMSQVTRVVRHDRECDTEHHCECPRVRNPDVVEWHAFLGADIAWRAHECERVRARASACEKSLSALRRGSVGASPVQYPAPTRFRTCSPCVSAFSRKSATSSTLMRRPPSGRKSSTVRYTPVRAPGTISPVATIV